MFAESFFVWTFGDVMDVAAGVIALVLVAIAAIASWLGKRK